MTILATLRPKLEEQTGIRNFSDFVFEARVIMALACE